MGYELFIARRHLSGKRKTGFISVISFLSLAGVTVGVAALLVVISVMNGFQQELRSKILGVTAHVIILRYQNEPIPDYEPVIATIRANPDVVSCSPFIYTKSMVAVGQQVDGVVLRGIDPALEGGVTDVARNIVAGEFAFGAGPGELPPVVMGIELADRLHAHLGDTVTVASPQAATITPLSPSQAVSSS